MASSLIVNGDRALTVEYEAWHDMVDNEQSGHDSFLEKGTLFCLEQAWEQTSFNLCNAQPQFLWYGRRSTSKSLSDKLQSLAERSIISAAIVAIVPVLISFKFRVQCGYTRRVCLS